MLFRSEKPPAIGRDQRVVGSRTRVDLRRFQTAVDAIPNVPANSCSTPPKVERRVVGFDASGAIAQRFRTGTTRLCGERTQQGSGWGGGGRRLPTDWNRSSVAIPWQSRNYRLRFASNVPFCNTDRSAPMSAPQNGPGTSGAVAWEGAGLAPFARL